MTCKKCGKDTTAMKKDLTKDHTQTVMLYTECKFCGHKQKFNVKTQKWTNGWVTKRKKKKKVESDGVSE